MLWLRLFTLESTPPTQRAGKRCETTARAVGTPLARQRRRSVLGGQPL